jgi:large subunit ribosomal protein L7/L12
VEHEKIVEAIEGMTVVQLNELVKALEEKFGVSAAAMAVAAAPVAGGAAAAVVEEQTEFDVILKDFGANKIKAIKVVRELTGLGLKEAKEAVEAVPQAIKKQLTKEDAEKAAEKLKEVGCTVEIK